MKHGLHRRGLFFLTPEKLHEANGPSETGLRLCVNALESRRLKLRDLGIGANAP